eukprot:12239191-Alexandrium_andersonii.AAC.1
MDDRQPEINEVDLDDAVDVDSDAQPPLLPPGLPPPPPPQAQLRVRRPGRRSLRRRCRMGSSPQRERSHRAAATAP